MGVVCVRYDLFRDEGTGVGDVPAIHAYPPLREHGRSGSVLFNQCGVYVSRSECLRALERSTSKNDINGDRLASIFASQLMCMKLEWGPVNDEIIVSYSVITALFRRFVGREPNYPNANVDSMDALRTPQGQLRGLSLVDMRERG